MSPTDLLANELFAVLLVFARLAAIVMLLPGFGESYVDPRLRLWVSLLTSVLVAQALGDRLPAPPTSLPAWVAVVAGEVVLGLAIGSLVRLALAALHVAGSIVALQSGLAAAAYFDPSEATQGTVPGAFLSILFLVLLFATDGHHVLLGRIVEGYGTLPAGGPLPLGDLVELATRLGSAALATGLAIAAPLLLAAFLANLALGLLARLVPSLQVLFVALPLQLILALAVLAIGLAGGLAIALRFLDRTSLWLAG
ncbi:MAG: flagellar biosynthetic protein FliR [Geminicoccaceae bacterium]|nr:flagellar biosynthetic protein FliR [Geminicoccaceae bacterium]